MAGGAQLKSYAAAAQALTLVVYVPVYGWLASKLPRQRCLMTVILFFVGCIQLFFFGSRLGVPHLGFIFFVWVGIFSLTTIAQFWSYANEIYARADGERLFPLIAVGSAAGAPLGAALAERLFALHLSPFVMMQIAAGILLLLPIVALGAYGLASIGAGLTVLLYVKIAENSTDYSVMNTGKQMLWLPTTREEKYKAKQAIDTFFVRSGDMLAAGVVFVGTHLLTFGVTSFACANIAFVLIGIGVAILLLREYNRMTAPAKEQPLVDATLQLQEG